LVSLSAGGGSGSGANRERELTDPQGDPESEAAKREFLDALHEAMVELEPDERLLLRLRYEQDLSLEEISNLMQLGTPLKAQRSIQKALSKVRQDLLVKGISSVSVKDS